MLSVSAGEILMTTSRKLKLTLYHIYHTMLDLSVRMIFMSGLSSAKGENTFISVLQHILFFSRS